jgi:flagellar motility protein MotE (MotC chaperone)
MAEHGEWTRKGASLSDATAQKEYGVDRDFIIRGIQAEKLEYRRTVLYGNPCLRILRSQLEAHIAEELGAEHLASRQQETELRKVKKEIASLKRKLKKLEARKAELEA